MTKPGLAALADTYGFKRDELHHLKLVVKQLFDEIREEIPRMTGKPLRTAALDLRLESLALFGGGQSSRHFAAVADEDGVVAVLRVEQAIARALVAVALGRRPSGAQGGDTMTMLESEVLLGMVAGVLLHGVSRAILPMLGSKQPGRSMRVNDPAELAAEMSGAGQQLMVSSAECEFESARGALALALAPRVAARLRAGIASQARQESGAERMPRVQRMRASGVGGAHLPLCAVLGSTTISLAEIRQVASGSIIFLRKMNGQAPQVELKCSGTPLFSGTVVRDRGWYRFVVEQRMWSNGKSV